MNLSKIKLNKNIYIISGGPGFGKTSLIENLKLSGYICSGEFARELINYQKSIDGDILPWKDPAKFQQEVFKKRLKFYNSVNENSIAFVDRGVPDQIAFALYKGYSKPISLLKYSNELRYAKSVFICPPWFNIYCNDEIRTETFHEASVIHNLLIEVYSELNYEIVELPLLTIKERTDFIIGYVSKK